MKRGGENWSWGGVWGSPVIIVLSLMVALSVTLCRNSIGSVTMALMKLYVCPHVPL